MPSTRGFTQTAGNIGPDGLLHFPDADGNEFDPTMIPGLDIEQPGTIPGQFNGAFTTGQMDFMNNLAGQVSNQYNQPLPANPAAQINLGQLPQLQTQQYGGAQAPVAQQYGGGPQPTAQQLGISDELRQLLSGQGLDPATLARMRAQATDQVSDTGRGQMSQARIALQQAGLQGSPAGLGIQADVSRQTASNQNSALNDILIQNALMGLQNQREGVGQQTQIGLANTGATNQMNAQNAANQTQVGLSNMAQYNAGQQANADRSTQVGLSNMQQANQMALAQANMLFSGLQQNAGFQQQAGQNTFAAANDRTNAQANATSNVLGNLGSQWSAANLDRANTADTANVTNRMSWADANAAAERNRQLTNQGVRENRNSQALGLTGANFGIG